MAVIPNVDPPHDPVCEDREATLILWSQLLAGWLVPGHAGVGLGWGAVGLGGALGFSHLEAGNSFDFNALQSR